MQYPPDVKIEENFHYQQFLTASGFWSVKPVECITRTMAVLLAAQTWKKQDIEDDLNSFLNVK